MRDYACSRAVFVTAVGPATSSFSASLFRENSMGGDALFRALLLREQIYWSMSQEERILLAIDRLWGVCEATLKTNPGCATEPNN